MARTPSFLPPSGTFENRAHATAERPTRSAAPSVREPERSEASVPTVAPLDAGAYQGELLAAFEVARRFPRDPERARAEIQQDLDIYENAKEAIYEVTKGGKTLVGGSVDLARLVRRRWRNMRSGFRVVAQTHDVVIVEGWAQDLETGDYQAQQISSDRELPRAKGQGTYRLDGDMLSQFARGLGARAERNCISDLVPYDLWCFACSYARDRKAAGNEVKTVAERLRELLDTASELFVPEIALERFCGKPVERFTFEDIRAVDGAFAGIRSGEATAEEIFDGSSMKADEIKAAAARTAQDLHERKVAADTERREVGDARAKFAALQARFTELKHRLGKNSGSLELEWKQRFQKFGVQKISELTLDMVEDLTALVADHESQAKRR